MIELQKISPHTVHTLHFKTELPMLTGLCDLVLKWAWENLRCCAWTSEQEPYLVLSVLSTASLLGPIISICQEEKGCLGITEMIFLRQVFKLEPGDQGRAFSMIRRSPDTSVSTQRWGTRHSCRPGAMYYGLTRSQQQKAHPCKMSDICLCETHHVSL